MNLIQLIREGYNIELFSDPWLYDWEPTFRTGEGEGFAPGAGEGHRSFSSPVDLPAHGNGAGWGMGSGDEEFDGHIPHALFVVFDETWVPTPVGYW